jgi:Zn-dependent peptidase ImmA (M78 family)/DNA-binding XRE family transcriptional regulator
MIGSRLRLARTAADLSLRDLSAAIGGLVTAQAIGKYERDEAMPGSKILLAMAAALGVSADYLLSDAQVALDGVDFRKKPSASRKEEAQVEAKVLHRVEQYLVVEEALGLDSARWDKPRHAPYPVQQITEADQAAMQMRQAWGLGRDPIPNLVELLEERGLKVICEHLAEPIDGMTAHVRRSDGTRLPVIVVNSVHWGERQRFTLAHELGHAVMAPATSLSEADVEKAAHRFAGAFLMPAEILWTEIGRHRSSISLGELFSLKSLLGVSVQALAYRCKDLGIFGAPLMRQLFETFTREGWRSPPYAEPVPVPRESAQRLARLCFRAVEENVLSEARAAETLGISVRDLDRRMAAPWEVKSSPA